MVEIAAINECNVLVKANRWYLKKGLPGPTEKFLKYNQTKGFYPGITTYLIVYDTEA